MIRRLVLALVPPSPDVGGVATPPAPAPADPNSGTESPRSRASAGGRPPLRGRRGCGRSWGCGRPGGPLLAGCPPGHILDRNSDAM